MLKRWLGLLLLPALAGAATWRVDGAVGDDNNDGQERPFRTIARGLAALQSGDTLALTPMVEPYRESLPLTKGGRVGQPTIIDGSGATLSGADRAPTEGWAEAAGIYILGQPTEVKFLFGPETRYEAGPSATELGPEQWFWADGALHFRPAAGKTPADYQLEMSVRVSGVLTNGEGQILVRNLTCQHFYNDGFNLHGGSAPLWFENIRGVWNGDEGFSAHENCECYVRGGEFSNNYWHGIADIDFSRTHYQNIVCRDNRSKGIYFFGGMHSVTDSEVSGSPEQVVITPSSRRGFPLMDKTPLRGGLVNLRSVLVRSEAGQRGVVLMPEAAASLEHCLVIGGEVGISVAAGSRAYAINSVISGASQTVVAAGAFGGDYNLYYPGSFQIAGTRYGPEQFTAYQQATGNDANSWLEEPLFVADSTWLSRASHGAGGAFGPRAFGGPDVGPERRGERPAETGVQPAGSRPLLAGGEAYRYDFEEQNPWRLVYPAPDKNQAGAAVTWTAELSAEQAHAGGKSGKFSVTLPVGPPAAFNLKLFSDKFEYRYPITGVTFWLYGDGSGRSFRLRVRDGHGEAFYDAPRKLDWTGWQEVSWDLLAAPPASILGGDGNLRQDVPPVEFVMEVEAEPDSTLVLYIDDLELRTGSGQAVPPPTQPAEPGQAAPPAEPGTLPLITEADAAAPAPAPVATETTATGQLLRYDFEQANLWSRLYPEPATKESRGSAALSEEQAHGGAKSLKLEVQLPSPSPNPTLKLFSARMPWDKPVRAVRFWLYGDGRERSLVVRVRDKSGESHYRAAQTVDWSGWREVRWDLEDQPPANIAGGDRNQRIDGPPVELVLELRPGEDRGPMLLYLDDLEVQLAE